MEPRKFFAIAIAKTPNTGHLPFGVTIWLNLIFFAVESLSSICFTISVFGWNENDVDLFLEGSSFVFELDPTSSVGRIWEDNTNILELSNDFLFYFLFFGDGSVKFEKW